MVTQLQIIYEIPLVIFLFLAVYTIYQLKKAKTHLGKSPIADSFKWIILASVFFTLWGVMHIYSDVSPAVDKSTGDFLHFIISHGFLLIAMGLIAIAARKILQFAYNWKKK